MLLAILMGVMLTGPSDPAVLTAHQIPHEATPQTLAVQIANEHNLNVERFLKVIDCESGWNPDAIGDSGTSFGLAQLHQPVRDWGLTIEQAKDPRTALTTMAEAWQRGEASRWTCWRIHYGK